MGRDIIALREELEEERIFDNIMMAGLFSVVVMFLVPVFLQVPTAPQVQAMTEAPDTVAVNVGLIWILTTPLNQPNEVRIMAENSTGAFEQVLLGLTT